MKFKKAIVLFSVLALVAAVAAAPANAGKKKGPKPFKSSDGIIAVPHTLLYATTSEVNSVTANEFEARCAIPASNGLDAYVWEVPAEYQKIESNIKSFSSAESYQLYVFFYKSDCTLQPYSLQAAGTTDLSKNAPYGLMPKDTAYVLIANFLGHPGGTVWFELAP